MPSNHSGQQVKPDIPWQRFWRPLDSTVDCGENGRGLLADPESEFGRFQNPNLHRLGSLVPPIGPLILCGEPGMGKTSELSRLYQQLTGEQQTACAFVKLNARQHIGDMAELREHTIKSERWLDWRAGTHTLTFMLDAVDEGRVRIPALVSQLAGMLGNEPVERLRLILTCRSAEWPHEMGRELLALWHLPDIKNKPLYELCPLRQVDAVLAAETYGLPADTFMSALWEKQISGMATRPVTLLFLLDEFRSNHAFPATRQQLYERGVRKLCHEVDPQRIEALQSRRKTENIVTLDQRLSAAEQIAAVALCSGSSSIIRDTDSLGEIATGCLPLTACSTQEGQPTIPALEEVIESALFTSVGKLRHGFAHLTFAECLAAQALKRLPLRQVRSLLLQTDDTGEHVIPQLIELAAWTAGSHREFCRHLLRVDPVALLRCDAALLPDDLKKALIDAILLGVEQGHILNEYAHYTFFHSLKHPDIIEQLRPWITDRSRSQDARSIAIEMAERCHLSELANDLWAVIRGCDQAILENAAEALCEILPENRLAELEALVQSPSESDPDQEILGCALKRLIPSHWKIRNALPFLTKRRNDSLIGSYHVLLERHLPPVFEQDDIVPVLGWIEENQSSLDHLSSRNALAVRAIVAALHDLDKPQVAQALLSLWMALVNAYSISSLTSVDEIKKLLLEDASIRQQLLTLVLNNIDDTSKVHSFRLAGEARIFDAPEDLSWLLDEILKVSPDRQPFWAAMIADRSWDNRLLTPNWDKFLDRLQSVRALSEKFPWLRVWELNAPETRKIKADWLRTKRRDEKWQKKFRKHDEDPAEYRRRALRRIQESDPDAWYSLWHNLHWGERGKPSAHTWHVAVDQLPGWKFLDSSERHLAVEGARAFLTLCGAESVSWHRNSRAAMAAACAVWLLQDMLEIDDCLLTATSNHWVRFAANVHDDDDPEALKLFALLYRLRQQSTLDALRESLDEDRLSHRHLFAIRHAKECWDQRLSDFIADYLRRIDDPQAVRSGIEEWMKFDRPASAKFSLTWLHSSMPTHSGYPLALRDALVVTLIWVPGSTFNQVLPILQADESLAASVWGEVLYDSDLRKGTWHQEMSEEQLGILYLHLSQVFPEQEASRQSGWVSRQDEAARGRENIPSVLASRGTNEACATLAGLRKVFPDRRGIAYHYHAAINNKRRNAWSQPSPEEVSILLRNPKSRLVQSEQDLLELVLESLERIQQKLTDSMLPAAEELWLWVGGGNKRKDFRPKDEEAFSAYIARRLMEDIGPVAGVVVNCEVQPRRGSRTDILVEATAKVPGSSFDRLSLVVEVKGCWHPDVKTGMHSQLVEGYLRDLGLRTGLYLVGWFSCGAWSKSVNHLPHETIEESRAWLDHELSAYDGKQQPELVRGIILDSRLSLAAPSKKAKSKVKTSR